MLAYMTKMTGPPCPKGSEVFVCPDVIGTNKKNFLCVLCVLCASAVSLRLCLSRRSGRSYWDVSVADLSLSVISEDSSEP